MNAEVKTRTGEGIRGLFLLLKEAGADSGSQRVNGAVGCKRSVQVGWERGGKPVGGKPKAEAKGAACTGRAGVLEEKRPIELRVRVEESGGVADRAEMLPAEFGGVEAMNEEEIFRGQGGDVAAAEGDGCAALPYVARAEANGEVARYEAGAQNDARLIAGADEDLLARRAEEIFLLLGGGVLNAAITFGEEQVFGGTASVRENKQVRLARVAESGRRVASFGEDGAAEGKDRERVGGETVEKAEELGEELGMAAGVLVEGL